MKKMSAPAQSTSSFLPKTLVVFDVESKDEIIQNLAENNFIEHTGIEQLIEANKLSLIGSKAYVVVQASKGLVQFEGMERCHLIGA